ncbi:hypothetical protein DXA13_10975 [Clostridium sp. AM58-1XD]|nr:hypothetical protein DXA13_10975 [Clostridium sp. AM58-1XD]
MSSDFGSVFFSSITSDGAASTLKGMDMIPLSSPLRIRVQPEEKFTGGEPFTSFSACASNCLFPAHKIIDNAAIIAVRNNIYAVLLSLFSSSNIS